MASSLMVDLQGVRFGWNRQTPVLDIPRLQIERGSRVFLYGPSGCGKSTLLGLLGGVLLAGEGVVRIMETDLTPLSAARRDQFRADHIGFVFQQFNLIPYLSIVDNVLLPCRFSERRRQRARAQSPSLEAEARRLLAQLGLDRRYERRSVTELSIGQQQRVAAARALIGSPPLLIADEPTSALDEESRGAFLELLFQECEREAATLVFVSHDQSLRPLFSQSLSFLELNRAAARQEG